VHSVRAPLLRGPGTGGRVAPAGGLRPDPHAFRRRQQVRVRLVSSSPAAAARAWLAAGFRGTAAAAAALRRPGGWTAAGVFDLAARFGASTAPDYPCCFCSRCSRRVGRDPAGGAAARSTTSCTIGPWRSTRGSELHSFPKCVSSILIPILSGMGAARRCRRLVALTVGQVGRGDSLAHRGRWALGAAAPAEGLDCPPRRRQHRGLQVPGSVPTSGALHSLAAPSLALHWLRRGVLAGPTCLTTAPARPSLTITSTTRRRCGLSGAPNLLLPGLACVSTYYVRACHVWCHAGRLEQADVGRWERCCMGRG
jgi:hypothetical protein